MPFLTINDINLYYEIKGQGEPILFIHGLGASTRDWEFQVDAFQDYQVITFDLRGHGKSDKPNQDYTVPLFAKDTALLIQTLSFQSVHVVGHSLGGMVAFQLAVDHPKLVKTLTIVNSAPAVVFPRIRDHFTFFLRSVYVKLFGMHLLSSNLSKMLFPKPEQIKLREIFVKRWCENDPKAYLHALKAFRHWDILDKISKIACPTLIIAAENDYTPVELKEAYAKKMQNCELVVIQDSGHLTIVDQYEIFNNTLRKFLLKNQ